LLPIHPSARKHGIADEDIRHAVAHAIAIEHQMETRLYIGPARNADLLEVATARREGRPEIAIHAMRMRRRYRRLLFGAPDG
jgi:hypothetical protein